MILLIKIMIKVIKKSKCPRAKVKASIKLRAKQKSGINLVKNKRLGKLSIA